jgi:hypothetical protein
MRTLGRLVTLAGIIALVASAVVGAKSAPDLKRYQRMRAM